MSGYALIGAGIVEGVAIILTGISTTIIGVKANQSKNSQEKAALRAASILLGLSILFVVLAFISGFIVSNTKNCAKRTKIFFLVFFFLFLASFITALTIVYIYARKRTAAGDTDGARDLMASFVMPIIALVLHIVAFIILSLVLGKRTKMLRRACA